MKKKEISLELLFGAAKSISRALFGWSSTTYSLAKRLPDGHYTIITSGANIAVELSQRNV